MTTSLETAIGLPEPADSVGRSPRWMRGLALVGFGAKGIVYLTVGGIAMAGGASGGKTGALAEISRQPFGQILLAALAIGLGAHALWCFVTGIFDPRGAASDASGMSGASGVSGVSKGIGKRFGQLAGGVVYAGLAIAASRILLDETGGSIDLGFKWSLQHRLIHQ